MSWIGWSLLAATAANVIAAGLWYSRGTTYLKGHADGVQAERKRAAQVVRDLLAKRGGQ